MQPSRELSDLLTLMQRLRTECPWDQDQTRASLTPYLLEEAYEAVEALQSGDPHEIKDELGDVLFQVVFHAQVALEAGEFDMGAIIYGLMEKLIRRHPHVFSDQSDLTTEQVAEQWKQIKLKEKQTKNAHKLALAEASGERYVAPIESVFKVKPASALSQAQSLQQQASKIGFDWSDAKSALTKLREEIDELEAEVDQLKFSESESSSSTQGFEDTLSKRLIDEMGDVLFSSVNVARKLGLDAEQVTVAANQKFNRRMNAVDQHLKNQASSLELANLKQMQTVWDEIKQTEQQRGG